MDSYIFIFGEIGGWGVDANEVLKQISDAKKNKAENIIVQISSPGGYVNDGKAIYNALKVSGAHIRVEIIGQAYSIASYIAMAGDEILIAEKAEMMIHPAWTFTDGNAEKLRETADELEKISNEIYSVYLERGAKDEVIKEWFDAEKIITSAEAIEAGLATGILEPLKAVAKYTIKTESKMDNNLINNLIKRIDKFFKVKDASVETSNGVLFYEGELSEGTSVYADEAMTEAAADGDYTVGGNTYTVSGGVVTAVATAEPAPDAEALKAEIESLQNKITELSATLEASNAEKAEAITEVTNLKSELGEIKNILIQEKIERKPEAPEVPQYETVSAKMKRLAKEAMAKNN